MSECLGMKTEPGLTVLFGPLGEDKLLTVYWQLVDIANQWQGLRSRWKFSRIGMSLPVDEEERCESDADSQDVLRRCVHREVESTQNAKCFTLS